MRLTSPARLHAEWMSLMEVSGPFLSIPVLLRVFPQGLDRGEAETPKRLRQAWEEWLEAQEDSRDAPAVHRDWIRHVLTDALSLPEELLLEGPRIPATCVSEIREQGETLRPDYVLVNPAGGAEAGKVRLLIHALDPGQGLDRPLKGRTWSASPATRMMELLHGAGGERQIASMGLVTNGDEWMLVYAPRDETTGFATWRAEHWFDEPVTLQAFRSLLSASRFFGVAATDTLEALLAESTQHQQEVTDQLGLQVRNAVEMLVQTIDRIDKDSGRKLLAGVSEAHLYEAAVTVMMRLVFLMTAEERDLLPLKDEFYLENYSISNLGGELREAADQHGEEVLERRSDAWGRLLATFRAVHGGVHHERMRLPAYGGTLFDPDRFPFLEGRVAGTRWREMSAEPLDIDNRTVLHLLEALQFLEVKLPGGGPAERRRLSFRALDIEQIGHVYESLLDHQAVRAKEPYIGLLGTKDKEPEVALAELEGRWERGEDDLLDYLREETGRSVSALRKTIPSKQPKKVAESADSGRLLAACDTDHKLFARVAPFAALVRNNSRGYPTVVAKDGVFVTAGLERRSTGTHYTPRSLTEPMVRHALDPLVYDGPSEGRPRDDWKLRAAREILGVRVCDFAMGSGAFLVQACRYLSERLVEAWAKAEKDNPGRFVVTPEGDLSNGHPRERLVPPEAVERLAIAKRIVADRCLYGVDVNPMAVEMAKLSLWLVTMQRDRPFTFLDHALRCGDSLLGVTDPAQIELLSLDPEAAQRAGKTPFLLATALRGAIGRAMEKRRTLEGLVANDIRDVEEKARLQREAEEELASLKTVGHLIVLGALSTAEEGKETLDALLAPLATEVQQAFDAKRPEKDRARALEDLRRRVDELLASSLDPHRRQRRPFHWLLEFPEVFADEELGHRGFDAIVSNPPFRGGQFLRQTLGNGCREYLVERIGKGVRGSADLCAYFFLRAGQLVRTGGGFGMLATNTIAQGDTREVGLEQLTRSGFAIQRAVPSEKWPGEATLEVSHVWIQRGDWKGERVLNNERVTGITPLLSARGTVEGKPFRLVANEGKCFQGSIVLGKGFVVKSGWAQSLIKEKPKYSDVLSPYLIGKDVNSRPDQSASRWVIDFHDWPLEQAQEYPKCFEIVQRDVRPEREQVEYSPRAREFWWRYERPRGELYAAIAGMKNVIVVARLTHHFGLSAVSSRQVLDGELYVFPLGLDWECGVLQSSIHEAWARSRSSTFKLDLRYSPSRCLETFPFPSHCASAGATLPRYHAERQALMLTRQEGLTSTYNRFHDPEERAKDITGLRDLHVELDQAVAAAYGWGTLLLGHGFHKTNLGTRFTISEKARVEVLARLLKLNHERYADEVARGLHAGKKKPGGKKGKKVELPSDELW